MPALFTHYEFGQKVLNKLNTKLQTEINENIEYYNMFNQGFDNLYYHFNWNYYKSFGVKCHKKNIDKLFEFMIKYIIDNNLENNSKVTSMIYGLINHYTLDTLLHPFINYQVKNLNITHTRIEFMLDAKIRKNKSNSIYKVLIPKLKFTKELLNFINETFIKIHNEANIGKIFNRSHNNGYYLYRYFINDNYGIKTFLYKIIDFLLPLKKFILNENTFYIKSINDNIYNHNKEIWYHPNNRSETYNYSYEELYEIAYKICIKLNNEAYKILHTKKDINNIIDKIKLINLKNIPKLLQK